MQLTKHHGLGNDFLIVLEEAGNDLGASGDELARRWCDRRTGVGADGLIYGQSGDEHCDVSFRLWNSDGSRAVVSGNGLRCLAQALAMHRDETTARYRILLEEGDTLPTDIRVADVRPTADPVTLAVTVDMGPVTAGPDISTELLLPGKAASAAIGNPHLVVLVDDPAAVDLITVGPDIERHFWAGINVEFIAAADPNTIDLVVWERGSGITRACGSGACVAAHVAHEWGLVGDQVTVRMPGGSAEVTLTSDNVRLSGPTTFVGRIEVPDA